MKRLKNLGWLALVFMVAILLYPLSLNVAAMHSDLVAVDREILDTKREISFLQAEIRTRASLQQLEEWNELLYGYQPPSAEQFVNGEAALAGLTGDLPDTKPVMMAAADVPAPQVVAEPAVAKEAVVEPQKQAAPKAAATKLAANDVQIFANPVKRAAVKVEAPKVEQSRTERLARMDEKLLSDDLLRDISAKAAKERRR
ncbi:MAG: hypothetical protein CFE36_05725 [Sphingomonadaceae bacterium PASS1]|jgi:hypothetical protein|nr:MAG: hypothetical protein CFE36_05725 [Sphingomonadaceae bacterium PASS1]